MTLCHIAARPLLPCALFFLSLPALADTPPAIVAEIPLGATDTGKKPPLLRLELGTTSGTAHEYVYDQGLKLSELIWDFKNVVVGGGKVTFRPKPTLRWSIGYWTALDAGSGTMNDYDWINPPYRRWDAWSISPIKTEAMSRIDLNLTKTLAPVLGGAPNIGIGYRKFDATWSASGGRYDYTRAGGTKGRLPNVVGITLTRQYTIPYLAAAMVWQGKNLSLDLGGSYSQWVGLQETDTHHLRALVFDATFSDLTSWDAYLDLGYPLSATARLTLNAAIEGSPTKKGGTKITDLAAGTIGYAPSDSAGASLSMWRVGLGYEKSF